MIQFSFFLIAGATAYAGYVATFYMARPAGDLAALTLAYVVSVAIHFSLNKAMAFRNSGAVNLRMLSRYALMVALNYVVSTFVGFALINAGVWPVAAIAIGTGATTITGFILSKSWIFSS